MRDACMVNVLVTVRSVSGRFTLFGLVWLWDVLIPTPTLRAYLLLPSNYLSFRKSPFASVVGVTINSPEGCTDFYHLSFDTHIKLG
jgi:hypothetical protein